MDDGSDDGMETDGRLEFVDTKSVVREKKERRRFGRADRTRGAGEWHKIKLEWERAMDKGTSQRVGGSSNSHYY